MKLGKPLGKELSYYRDYDLYMYGKKLWNQLKAKDEGQIDSLILNITLEQIEEIEYDIRQCIETQKIPKQLDKSKLILLAQL